MAVLHGALFMLAVFSIVGILVEWGPGCAMRVWKCCFGNSPSRVRQARDDARTRVEMSTMSRRVAAVEAMVAKEEVVGKPEESMIEAVMKSEIKPSARVETETTVKPARGDKIESKMV